MSSFFRRLFSSNAPSTDGFSQTQREAIVDLLNFCMCADSALLPEEREAIATELKSYHWDPAVDIEKFAAESRTRAAAAVKNPGNRVSLLKSIAGRLVTTEAKTHALALCPQVFMADGESAPEEHEIFLEIKRAFGWPV